MKRFMTAYIQGAGTAVSVCGWLQDAGTGQLEDLFCTGLSDAENRLLCTALQQGRDDAVPEPMKAVAAALRQSGCGAPD